MNVFKGIIKDLKVFKDRFVKYSIVSYFNISVIYYIYILVHTNYVIMSMFSFFLKSNQNEYIVIKNCFFLIN